MKFAIRCRFAAFTLLIAGATPKPVASQAVSCTIPENCNSSVPSGAKNVVFVAHLDVGLQGSPSGKQVYVTRNIGIRMANALVNREDTTLFQTNADGSVSGIITEPIKSEVSIKVQGAEKGSVIKTITITPQTPLEIDTSRPQIYYYYAGAQVRPTVVVKNVDKTRCEGMTARFKTFSGGAIVDSVRGAYEEVRGFVPTLWQQIAKPKDVGSGNCAFTTYWRLDPSVGRQVAHANIETLPAVRIETVARQKAHLGIALGFRKSPRTPVVVPATSPTVKVTRTDAATGTTTEELSITGKPSIGGNESSTDPALFVLFDSALRPKETWLRFAAGVSASKPKEDFFIGISALHLIFGMSPEDAGGDIFVGTMINRSERLVNAPLCEQKIKDGLSNDASCSDTTSKVRFPGLGVFFSADASSLISTIGKALGIG